MTEVTDAGLLNYIRNVETKMLKQWDNMNQSINAFELSLKKQREVFEVRHLNMLKEIHEETQKCVSDIHSKSNDIRDVVTVVRDKLSYLATTQNLEEITANATKEALKGAKDYINKDLWDENLNQIFRYLKEVAEAIGHFSGIVFAYDLRLQKDHPSLFNEVVVKQRKFLATPVAEAEFSVRTTNCLLQAGCKTIKDVVDKDKLFLLKQRNFGRKSINEIRAKFDDHGVKWEE